MDLVPRPAPLPERGRIRRQRFVRAALERGDPCHLCGKYEFVDESGDYRMPVADHILPRSKGGTSDPNNLALAHHWCNSRRGDMSMEAWNERRARQQQARDAAAEVAEPKILSWKITNHNFLVFRRRYVRACQLHDEEGCVLCNG